MVLLLLFSVSLSEVIKPIENQIFKEYDGTVQVVFKNNDYEMIITKSGSKILIEKKIPVTREVGADDENLSWLEAPESEISSRARIPRKEDRFREVPIAYYDGKNSFGCSKVYFVSYIIFGCRCAFLYAIENLQYENSKLIGMNNYGLKMEFDRRTKYPKNVEIENTKYILSNWKEVYGFGSLPEKMEIFINDNKVETRKLESVVYPSTFNDSFFTEKKAEIPVEDR